MTGSGTTSNSGANNGSTGVLSKAELEAGREHVRHMFATAASNNKGNNSSHSTITDQSSTFPSFTRQQLTLGKVLGKGGFGTVSEVRAFACPKESEGCTTDPADGSSSSGLNNDPSYGYGAAGGKQQDSSLQKESRAFIAKHCLRQSNSNGKSGGDARYAVKELSPETKQDARLFFQGLIDMAVETRFLSDLEHPNIVKMRAVCRTDVNSSNDDGTSKTTSTPAVDPFADPLGYFIVMDRLYDTLEKRLNTWKKQSDRLRGGPGKLLDRKGLKAAALYEDRVVAAFDLSAALQYLHERRIVYRDLKPENIGFDIRDDIKVFDFGLSKELHMAKEKYNDGTYKLTAMTGSPRYMAPEVGLGKPYNEKCDVYSFAVLLWEMITLREPYELMTLTKLKKRVWEEGGEQKRPYIPADKDKKHKDAGLWTAPMKLLVKRSWCADVASRNSMHQVASILRKECVRARNGDDSGLEHNRRRSTFVFRPSGPASASKTKGRMGILERMTSTRKKLEKSERLPTIPSSSQPPEYTRSAPAAISSSTTSADSFPTKPTPKVAPVSPTRASPSTRAKVVYAAPPRHSYDDDDDVSV